MIAGIGLSIFIIYLIFMVGIGIYTSRFQKTTEDFWVAGRKFGPITLAIAIMASIMHGGSILSGLAYAAKFGGPAILPFTSFSLGFLIVLVIFARKLRILAGYTLPDYIRARFDSLFLQGFSGIVVAVASTIYLIGQMKAMGLVLSAMTGWDYTLSLLIGAAIFIFYTVLGGLLAVVWTNIAQFVFMWVGLVILLPVAFNSVGGWYAVLDKVEQVAPGWTSFTGVSWTVTFLISWYVVWLLAYSTRIEFVTKLYAAKDEFTARFSLPIALAMILVFLLYGNLYLGAVARILVWEGISAPDQAFTALVNQLMGPNSIGAALALAGIAAGAMSTTDSLLLMAGAGVAHDLIRKCYMEPKGVRKSETFYVAISRAVILLVGIVALFGALSTPQMILTIVSYAVSLIGVTFFAPLVFGLTWDKVSKEAAIISSVLGFATTALWIVLTISGVTWVKIVHPVLPGLVVSVLSIIILTPLTQKVSTENLALFFPEKYSINK